MRTARMETARASDKVATIACRSWWGFHNEKFEQVSRDHHQLSLAGVPRFDVHGGTLADLSREEVPYHVTYSMMHLMLPPSPTPPQ